jgi:membrane protease YdiL (CAAX protease family)
MSQPPWAPPPSDASRSLSEADRRARAFPHAEPTPYHLMLRTWSYAWWRPVVGVFLAFLAFVVGAALIFYAVGAVYALFQPGAFGDDFESNIDVDKAGAAALLALNLGLASMILVTALIMRVVHRMRPRWLASVVPKMRWRFLAVCLGLALVALVAQILVGSLLPGGNGDELGAVKSFTTSTAITAVVVLLTTPLQAAGEEYLFRGYLLQAFGSFFGNRWVAIVATATLFAVAHGSQNVPLFFDRFAFGLMAGWLVTRTGGLEAGIALHVLNNFLAFGIALTFGDLSTTLTVTEVSWWNIVLTVTQSGVYIALVLLVARRMRLQTRTQPPRDAPEESRGPAVATA